MSTWRELIKQEMDARGESFNDIVFTTLTEKDFDNKFYMGFGWVEGCPFTLWTVRCVYFPVTCDGSEWVSSVPRDPCEEKIEHIGR